MRKESKENCKGQQVLARSVVMTTAQHPGGPLDKNSSLVYVCVGVLTNEIIAANNRIFTKRSSNCSRTNCQMDLPVNKGEEGN